MLLEKCVLKILGKFTGEHPCRSVTSIKLQSKFIEVPPRHGCSPVNLLHIFRICFPKSTSGGQLLTTPHPLSCFSKIMSSLFCMPALFYTFLYFSTSFCTYILFYIFLHLFSSMLEISLKRLSKSNSIYFLLMSVGT